MCRQPNLPEGRCYYKVCELCNIKFDEKDELLRHNLSFHVTEKKFACDQCDFKTKIATSLAIHKRRIHEMAKDEVCPICGKELKDKYILQMHMDTAHNTSEKKFVCDKCGAFYAPQVSLKNHIKDKQRSYTLCTLCHKMFPSSRGCRELRVHLCNEHQVNCGLKDFYVCWKCHKGCLSVKELDDHLIADHGMIKDEEPCQVCEKKSFATKATLKLHVMESHDLDLSRASNTPFINDLFEVIKEQNVRTEPLSGVPCPVCHKMFTQKRSMVDHQRQVHEKESHMKCEFCDYSAFQPGLLKKHVAKKHLRTIIFECDQCPYTTPERGTLRVHKQRVHEKIKNFECSHCGKGFFKKPAYAQHLLKVHSVVYQYNA